MVPSIYIASSWKNKHLVVLLTRLFRERGFQVLSFVENDYGENNEDKAKDFPKWVWSDEGGQAFGFDTNSAIKCDALVYVGPSGPDAWAEVGCAYAAGKPIFGLWSKGDTVGLMRRMVWWQDSVDLLLKNLEDYTQKHAAFLKTKHWHVNDKGDMFPPAERNAAPLPS